MTPQHVANSWDDEADKTAALESLDVMLDQPTIENNPWEVPDTLPAATTVLEGAHQGAYQGTYAGATYGGTTQIGVPQMTDVEVIGPTVAEMPQTLPRQEAEQTVLRRKRATRRVEADDGRTLRRKKQRARRNAQQPINAIPSQPYAEGSVPGVSTTGTVVSQPLRRRPNVLLFLFVMLLRLAAIALCALVVILAVPAIGEQLGDRLSLMRIATTVGSLIPAQLSGLVVISTPFGGAFRGDFAVTAFVLYVIDWLLTRLRFRMRYAY